jgi:hypothetical protein
MANPLKKSTPATSDFFISGRFIERAISEFFLNK